MGGPDADPRTVGVAVLEPPVDRDAVAGPGPVDRPTAAPAGASVRRRPAVLAVAVLLGLLTLVGASSADVAVAAGTPAATRGASVAAELGLLRAQAAALSGEEAAGRLQEMVASRARRADAEAAAAQVQEAADQAARDAAAAAVAEAARPRVVLPIAGARLTSGFGARWGTLHAGIDLAAPMRTPEYAAMDGVVLQAGAASGYGLAVQIRHENGDVTVYGHMDSILVAEGQAVRAGDTIALLGNRGRSTGPHLHFEVRAGGTDGPPVDPVGWLRERGVEL